MDENIKKVDKIKSELLNLRKSLMNLKFQLLENSVDRVLCF